MQANPQGDFLGLYDEMRVKVQSDETEETVGPLLTISADNMPLSEFIRWVANESESSIICDKSLDKSPVTIDVTDTPLPHILSAIARRMGVDLTQQGNLYYLGTVKPEDRGLLVRQVRRLTAEDLNNALETQISEMGKMATYTDGLLIVSDRIQVLQRIVTMLDQIEAATSTTWLVQLHLLVSNNDFESSLGIDTESSLELSASFAEHSTDWKASGSLTALLEASLNSSDAVLVAEPMFLLIDGGESAIKDGTTIPIPKKTVSDAGTVTTASYTYQDTGLSLVSTIREMSPTTARYTLELENTSISGYVDDTTPIVTGQTFSTTAVVKSGGVYLLGSLSQKNTQSSEKGSLWPTYASADDSLSELQIWMKCYRIASSVVEASTPFDNDIEREHP